MRNKTRVRAFWVIGTVMALCLLFFLCRYVFLEQHELGDWPHVLLILGLIVIVIASFFDARKVMACTPSGYIIGFVFGTIFNVDSMDYNSRCLTNNFWLLWQNAFVIIIFIGIVWEIVSKILMRHSGNKKH